MRNLNKLNEYRICAFRDGYLGDKYNGMFEIPIRGSVYRVIASNGEGWEHVSVSNPNHTPSWEVMCKIKSMFFKDDEVVVQYHPKKTEYVNHHKHCLHLWRNIEHEFITPPIILV